ncbi:uncharacterized protein BCR38DRAFT_328295, partial [Pseudomassariella vexata]
LETRMRLSSRHLMLASPYFDSMLKGPWQEGTKEPGSDYSVYAEDWDSDALLILMYILHGRNRNVPRSVRLEMLAKFAVLVDYYKCHEAVELVAEMWISRLEHDLPKEYCRELVLWLFVSWVFSRADLFKVITGTILMESKGALQTLRLPIPEKLVDTIDQKRQESVEQILAVLHDLLLYLRDDRSGCTFECSSILLGALTKEMNTKGILSLERGSLLTGTSFNATMKAVLNIRSPRWYSNASYYGA